MKVMVTGSRDWPEDQRATIYDALDDVLRSAIRAERPLTLLHGCAAGPDSWAGEWAKSLALLVDVEPFPPDPGRPSPQRYHERNDRMLERADHVVAFWDGKSRGTKSVIRKARNRGLPYEVHSPAGVYVEV